MNSSAKAVRRSIAEIETTIQKLDSACNQYERMVQVVGAPTQFKRDARRTMRALKAEKERAELSLFALRKTLESITK